MKTDCTKFSNNFADVQITDAQLKGVLNITKSCDYVAGVIFGVEELDDTLYVICKQTKFDTENPLMLHVFSKTTLKEREGIIVSRRTSYSSFFACLISFLLLLSSLIFFYYPLPGSAINFFHFLA